MSAAYKQFLSDVVTAAGLLSHGKTDKALAERISKAAFELMLAAPSQPAEPVAQAAQQPQGLASRMNDYARCYVEQAAADHINELIEMVAQDPDEDAAFCHWREDHDIPLGDKWVAWGAWCGGLQRAKQVQTDLVRQLDERIRLSKDVKRLTHFNARLPDDQIAALSARRPVRELTDDDIRALAEEHFDATYEGDDETLVNKYGHGVYLSRFIDFARALLSKATGEGKA